MSADNFRRRLFENGFYGFNDRADRLGKRVANFFAGDLDRFGQSIDQIAPTYFHCEFLFQLVSRADFDFDLFCGSFSNHQVVDAADVANDCLVHLIARNAQRLRNDEAPQRYHGYVTRATADVDYHAAGRSVDR